jgi:hypothetical protein
VLAPGTVDACFEHLLPSPAASRRVIALGLQGHGHTADVDRPRRYETMAADVAELTHLGFATAD